MLEYDKKISDTVLAVKNAWNSLQNFAILLQKAKKNFEDFLKNYPTDGFYEVLCSYKLLDIYFPPCLHLSKEKNKRILSLLSENQQENIEQVEQIIFKTYNDEFLISLVEEWKGLVKIERVPILQEGVQAYLNSCYYSCNTTLLSQMGGIISDNDTKFSDCGIEAVIERLNELKELENEQRSKRKVSNEKEMLKKHLLINLQGSLCAFALYCLDYLYKSDKVDQKILDNVANRNKVLHGEMCNFGTKTMALKTIIAIDLLIHIP